jgi:hypothetical protein
VCREAGGAELLRALRARLQRRRVDPARLTRLHGFASLRNLIDVEPRSRRRRCGSPHTRGSAAASSTAAGQDPSASPPRPAG